jgi:hypothetical protein
MNPEIVIVFPVHDKNAELAPYLAQTVDLAGAFASHNRDLCQHPKRKPIFRIGSNFR